jgi:hypothetical protein
MNRRLFFSLASLVTLSLLGTMLMVASSSPTRAAAFSAVVVGGCSGATVTVSGLPPGTQVESFAYNANQYLDNEYQAVASNVAVFNLGWVQQPLGTIIEVATGIFDSTGAFIDASYTDFTCSVPGAGIPGHGVLAYFPAQTQVYGTPDTSHPVAGAVILAGQHFYVFEQSGNFYHVYLGGGTAGWVPVGSAQLEAPLYSSNTYCMSLTDNDDNCAQSTPPPVASSGGSTGGASAPVGVVPAHRAPPQ